MVNEMVLASEVNVDELNRIGTMLAMSGYFETAREKDIAIAQMCVKVMAGRELGFGPFASVNGIHVIKGKPAVSANLMAAAVKANPRYDYRVLQMDNEAARIEFFALDANGKRESLGVSTFTVADAKAAGTQNMEKYGRNMMFARAISNGVKWFAPDCFNGNSVYVPEELGTDVDGDGNVIDVEYRSVDKATGEVLSTTPQPTSSNGNGHASPATPPAPAMEIPQEVALWDSPDDAYEWAIGIGASENVYAARNAMTKIVEAHGGRFTKANAKAIYVAYYHERMARAQEKARAALEAVAAEPDAVPELSF